MVGDDSLTDEEDSFCDIYSTKKVTSTYNSLLQKIKSTETATRNDGRSDEESQGNVTEDDLKEEIDSYVPSLRKTKLDEEPPDIIVLDDTVPYGPVHEEGPVRRSARIRNKNNTLHSGVRSKKESKRKRVNKVCDVEILDDEGNNDFDSCLDNEINYEVSVKVVWKSVSVKTFRLRRFQKLTQIFDHYTMEENVPKEQIVLYLKNRKISPSDTPESLNLKVCDFIEGGILSDSTAHATEELAQNETCSNNKDSLLIKLQDVNKKCYKFSIGKNECLKLIMIKYAEQIETPLNKIKFYFDGEILNPSCTPDSYGLENDEIIDVKIFD